MSSHEHVGMPLPPWLAVVAGLVVILLFLPILGLCSSVPWMSLGRLLFSDSSLIALWLSVRTAAAATILSISLGLPLTTLLAKGKFRGIVVLRTLVLLPLVLPPVVSGLALLEAFGRHGLVGRPLAAIGIDVAFSTVAVVIAMTFVSLPFFVLTVTSALESMDPRVEQVAMTLGAPPSRVWWTVTLPSVRRAVAAGAVLAFARALGEFGATLTFAGSLPGVTRTLPLEIYLQREVNPQVSMALSLLLMVIAVAVVVGVHGRHR